jgi:hypothetical protein
MRKAELLRCLPDAHACAHERRSMRWVSHCAPECDILGAILRSPRRDGRGRPVARDVGTHWSCDHTGAVANTVKRQRSTNPVRQ